MHFHAVFRLDGPGEGYPAPDIHLGAGELATVLCDAIRAAAAQVTYRLPTDDARVLRFGTQVDAQPVRRGTASAQRLGEGEVTPEKVAGYIAKYATKAAEDFGLGDRLHRPTDLDHRPMAVSAHVRRMVETVAELAAIEPRLGRWLHMLGFPGHFATKSRAFSTTLGAIRGERRAYRLGHANARDETDGGEGTTLVVGSWQFAGMGYCTPGDAAPAASAAARAREHAELARSARDVERVPLKG